MAPRQNVTLSLPQDVLRKARVLAAHRNTSVTRLLTDLVEQIVQEDERYEAARRQAVEYLREGLPLGGRIAVARDEWHER